MVMVAILAGIAAPSYQNMIANSRQDANINSILDGLYAARSEAVKVADRVVLCASSNKTSCNGTNWSAGWIVFVDENSNSSADTGERIVRLGDAIDSGHSVLGSTNVANIIRYESSGDALESGTITICDPRGVAKAQAIVLTPSGKPKKSEVGAGGAALTCPT